MSDARLWLAGLVGIAGYATGLLASALLDLPAGASIVLTLVTAGIVAGLGSAPASRLHRRKRPAG